MRKLPYMVAFRFIRQPDGALLVGYRARKMKRDEWAEFPDHLIEERDPDDLWVPVVSDIEGFLRGRQTVAITAFPSADPDRAASIIRAVVKNYINELAENGRKMLAGMDAPVSWDEACLRWEET